MQGTISATYRVEIPVACAQDEAVWGDVSDPAIAAILRALSRGFLHYAWGAHRSPARVMFDVDPVHIDIAIDERDVGEVLEAPSPTDNTGLHRAIRERCDR